MVKKQLNNLFQQLIKTSIVVYQKAVIFLLAYLFLWFKEQLALFKRISKVQAALFL